jgi:hypothetical protein
MPRSFKLPVSLSFFLLKLCCVTCPGVPWLIIRGSGLNYLIFYTFSSQSLLITINYRATADLLTSQITRTRYPFPGNGCITGTITSKSLWSLHVTSCSITLECGPSRTQFFSSFLSGLPGSVLLLATNSLSLYRRDTDHAENTSTVAWRGPHRKHFYRIFGHAFFRACLPSRCLAMRHSMYFSYPTYILHVSTISSSIYNHSNVRRRIQIVQSSLINILQPPREAV